MRSLASIISSIPEDISKVIHIGAGYCTESELYKELGIESVLFVEPDAQLFSAATQKFLQLPHITVLQQAIAGKSEDRVYFQLSNKRFSSLLEPGRILEHYPNVTVTSKTRVNTNTLESLCEESPLAKDVGNLLVLELQGEELKVLENTPDHVLQKFKWVVVRSSKEILYGDPSALTTPKSKLSLSVANFDALCFEDDNPLYCTYLFIKNDAVLENQSLELQKQVIQEHVQSLTSEKKQLEVKMSEASEALTTAQSTLGEAQERVNNLTSENEQLVTQAAESSASLNSVQAELGKTHEQVNNLTKENKQLVIQAAEISDSLATSQTELGKTHDQSYELTRIQEQQVKQINGLSETLKTAENGLGEAQTHIEDLTSQNNQQQQRIEELTQSVIEHSGELKEANHALRINNKLVAKNDADLRDLQSRYRTAVDSQKQQHSLLSELQDKLIQASKFYRQLNIQNQHIKGDIFDDDFEDIERQPNQIDKN